MLAALVQPGLDRRRRSVVLILAVALVTALVLTESRNGWGALVLALPLVLGPVSWPWLLPLLALGLIPVLLAVWPGVPELLQDPARALVPESVWSRLSDSRYAGERVLASTRLSQWGVALQLIAERHGWAGVLPLFLCCTPCARANGMAIPTTCHWSWRSAVVCRLRLLW